jgi:glutathione peroxidase
MTLVYSTIKLFNKITRNHKIDDRPDSISPEFSEQSIYKIMLKSIEGKDFTLAQYSGKKILIVNTASECGYTGQYADLQKLQDKYNDKLVVIGVPANDFGGQEPDENHSISEFCQMRFGVEFQLLTKSVVVGKEKCELYKWLTNKAVNGWNEKEPTWNFCKYLISETGELLCFMDSAVIPDESFF